MDLKHISTYSLQTTVLCISHTLGIFNSTHYKQGIRLSWSSYLSICHDCEWLELTWTFSTTIIHKCYMLCIVKYENVGISAFGVWEPYIYSNWFTLSTHRWITCHGLHRGWRQSEVKIGERWKAAQWKRNITRSIPELMESEAEIDEWGRSDCVHWNSWHTVEVTFAPTGRKHKNAHQNKLLL